jgi:hypothetical protein
VWGEEDLGGEGTDGGAAHLALHCQPKYSRRKCRCCTARGCERRERRRPSCELFVLRLSTQLFFSCSLTHLRQNLPNRWHIGYRRKALDKANPFSLST